MDTDRFLQHAIDIARANLPYTSAGDAAHKASCAANSAIDEAEANIGPWIAKPLIAEQMGGRVQLKAKIVAALTTV